MLRLKPRVRVGGCIGHIKEVLGKFQVASEVKWLWSFPQLTLKGLRIERPKGCDFVI